MFKCTEPGCDKSFKTKSHLGIHKRFKHGIMGAKHALDNKLRQGQFHCPECDRSFAQKRFLGNHMRAHERRKNKTAIVMVKQRKGVEKFANHVIPEEVISYVFGKIEAIIENYCLNAQFSKPEFTSRVSEHLRRSSGGV